MISVFCGIKDSKSSFFDVVFSHDSDKTIKETNTTQVFAEKNLSFDLNIGLI